MSKSEQIVHQIKMLDERIAAGEANLQKAVQDKDALEAKLAEALTENPEPDRKLLATASEAHVRIEAWRRALERLRAEREAALGELLEVRASELEAEVGELEKQIRSMEDRAFKALQEAAKALGYTRGAPLILLYMRVMCGDFRNVEDAPTRFWPDEKPRIAELAERARSLREQAQNLRNHPEHRRAELQRLLAERT